MPVAERPDGSLARCLLPAADAAGEILAVLDPAEPADVVPLGSAALIPLDAG